MRSGSAPSSKGTQSDRWKSCINISKPGITKGQHWHNSKWEQFIVVHGHGMIQERNINTGEMVEFEVSGEKIESVWNCQEKCSR